MKKLLMVCMVLLSILAAESCSTGTNPEKIKLTKPGCGEKAIINLPPYWHSDETRIEVNTNDGYVKIPIYKEID